MKKVIVAVGTQSKQKLGYIREVLAGVGVEAGLKPVGAVSGVSSQPLTSAETKRGAQNRARAALRAVPQAAAGVGIEVGYERNRQGRYEMFCWVAVADSSRVVSQKSHAFLLPEYHQQVLQKGHDLGEKVGAYHAGSKDRIKKQVGELIRLRKPFITVALTHALLRFFNGR